MLGVGKAINMPQGTPYAEEMRKWEAYPSQYGPAGRPYAFRPFPMMVYRAEHRPGEGMVIADEYIVQDDQELRNMQSRGFHAPEYDRHGITKPGQLVAFEAIQRQHTEHGKLAAEREYQVQHNRLSPKAIAEVREAEAEHGARHLPDVPEKKKRGRKPKAQPPIQ